LTETVGSVWIAATPVGVFASVQGTLLTLADDHFEVVDAAAPPGLQDIDSLAVDAQGSTWVLVRSSRTLGRIVNGAYEPETLSIVPGSALRIGPDGRLWMATRIGPQRLVGERFEPVGSPLSISPSAPYAVGPDGTPYTVSNRRIVRLVGNTWEELPPHPGAGAGISNIAVAPDGAVWVATEEGPDGYGLARYADGRWNVVPPPVQTVQPVYGISGIAVDARGTAWVRFVLHHERYGDLVTLAIGRLSDGTWTLDHEIEGTALGGARKGRDWHQAEGYDDVVVDGSGTVWINGTNGIARYNDGLWGWALEGVPGQSDLTLGADVSLWAGGVGVHHLLP
jgi:ligand-binding sensor domain-containing protein